MLSKFSISSLFSYVSIFSLLSLFFVSLLPLLGFVDLVSIIVEFSCHSWSCDRNAELPGVCSLMYNVWLPLHCCTWWNQFGCCGSQSIPSMLLFAEYVCDYCCSNHFSAFFQVSLFYRVWFPSLPVCWCGSSLNSIQFFSWNFRMKQFSSTWEEILFFLTQLLPSSLWKVLP